MRIEQPDKSWPVMLGIFFFFFNLQVIVVEQMIQTTKLKYISCFSSLDFFPLFFIKETKGRPILRDNFL